MIALVIPTEHYTIAEGCQVVGRKGFSTMEGVTQIDFPDSLEELAEFAVSRTQIREFFAPSALKRIDEKAFFNCENLKTVVLNEGLIAIGENAFSGTAISTLTVPATIQELANPIAADTALTYAGADATFSIAEGVPDAPTTLFLDAQGILYRRESDGLHLTNVMNTKLMTCMVEPGTVVIEIEAFLSHPTITSVALPEGITEIQRGAFRNCRELVDITLPETLTTLGEDAFLDTNLSRINIPAALTTIGDNALITQGAHHGRTRPALSAITVAPGNPVFSMESGLLIAKRPDGTACVILCEGGRDVIRTPEAVTAIADYAFNGRDDIRELWISDRIIAIGMRGLAIANRIDLIHVDFAVPFEGHESLEVNFPETDRGLQAQFHALGTPRAVDIEAILSNYDSAILNASSFNAEESQSLSLYDQALRIVDRLRDPVLLAPMNRDMGTRILTNNLDRVCMEAAKHDDRVLIDHLVELNILNEDNIVEAIDSVGRVQDASIVGYLLDIKRRLAGPSSEHGFALDFEL